MYLHLYIINVQYLDIVFDYQKLIIVAIKGYLQKLENRKNFNREKKNSSLKNI